MGDHVKMKTDSFSNKREISTDNTSDKQQNWMITDIEHPKDSWFLFTELHV